MKQTFLSRRYHVLAVVFVCICSASSTPAATSDVGRRFLSERQVFVDRTTGAVLTALTTAATNDQKIYHTHPQWTRDGAYVVFRSFSRSRDGQPQLFALNEITGEIIQLTDGPGVRAGADSVFVARKSNKLYYLRQVEGRWHFIELDLDGLLPGSAPAAAGGSRERVVAVLPPDYRNAGGFTLDADERVAYLGVALREPPPREPGKPVPQVPSGIRAVDLATGAYSKVIDVPFLTGHVQANPWISGEILYCNETGGDAPQRMWIVKADGSGNRPLFEEEPKDTVTHEVFIDPDHVVFNLIGQKPEQRTRPTGIAVIGLRDGAVEPVGQTSGLGFLHSNGTMDGHWAAGDTSMASCTSSIGAAVNEYCSPLAMLPPTRIRTSAQTAHASCFSRAFSMTGRPSTCSPSVSQAQLTSFDPC
jgi:oligogalacturonide lyase